MTKYTIAKRCKHFINRMCMLNYDTYSEMGVIVYVDLHQCRMCAPRCEECKQYEPNNKLPTMEQNPQENPYEKMIWNIPLQYAQDKIAELYSEEKNLAIKIELTNIYKDVAIIFLDWLDSKGYKITPPAL